MKWGRIVGWLAVSACACAGAVSDDNAYVRKLSDAGNVTFESGASGIAGLDAKTTFDLHVDTNWNYDFELLNDGVRPEVSVRVRFTKVDVSLRHVVRLPAALDPSSAAYRALLLHEFDHVAVSLDERPRVLLESLLRDMGAFRMPWAGAAPPPAASINAAIRSQVEARKAAVVKLMQQAYAELDRATDHGRTALPNRKAFFSDLYAPNRLKAARLPFAIDIDKFAMTEAFRNAKVYYRE